MKKKLFAVGLLAILILGFLTVWGVSLRVTDQTPSPPSYHAESGPYARDQGYDIRAQVTLGRWTEFLYMRTKAGLSVDDLAYLPMTAGTDHPYDFSGRWNVPPEAAACGFTVQHEAHARGLGFWPLDASSTAKIAPDPSGEMLRITTGWWDTVFVALTPGVASVQTRELMFDNGLGLRSGYPSLTVQSVRVLCGNADCAAAASPAVDPTSIVMPTLPASLGCGNWIGVSWKWSGTTGGSGRATVEFVTDRGKVIVPLYEGKEPGA